MAFNSADIGAFKNVWVFCEQRQGKMMPTTFELISEGRKLADELGVELCGILLGNNVDAIAPELGNYGADKVYVYNSPLLKDYTTDAYTKVISEAVEDIKPEILLFGASNIGRDLAPRCAARLHTGLCADCTHLDIDMPIYKNFLKEASTLPAERIEKLGTVKINGADHDVSRKGQRVRFGVGIVTAVRKGPVGVIQKDLIALTLCEGPRAGQIQRRHLLHRQVQGLLLILVPGHVQGEGAACGCLHRAAEDELIVALGRAALRHGVGCGRLAVCEVSPSDFLTHRIIL